MVDPATLIGAWSLVRWRLLAPDDSATEPFGSTPRGQLLYTVDGRMSVVIVAGDRPHLADHPAERDLASRAAAFDGVHAYTGRWRLDGDTIVHHVEVASLSNYEGTAQRRRFVLDGDTLTLTTPPGRAAHIAPGSRVVGELVWRRMAAPVTPPSVAVTDTSD